MDYRTTDTTCGWVELLPNGTLRVTYRSYEKPKPIPPKRRKAKIKK